jgi:hypothetical protein
MDSRLVSIEETKEHFYSAHAKREIEECKAELKSWNLIKLLLGYDD